MGHVRLGRLPTSLKWQEVVALLCGDDVSVQSLAEATANAAIVTLEKSANDPTLAAIYHLMYEIPQAAKERDFAAALEKRGIVVGPNPTIFDVAQGMAKAIDKVANENGLRTDLGEMAKHAAISTFIDMASEASNTIWSPTPADMQSGIGSFTAPARFGEFSQRFHSELTYKVLNYFLHREMPRHVSATGPFHSIADLRTFESGLRKHCMEASMIMRPFARDSLGKMYSGQEKMDARSARKFIYVSTNKIARELRKRGNDA